MTVTLSTGSYVKNDGTVVDPILDTSGNVLDYDGPKLKADTDLTGADLTGAFLKGADLTNTNLAGADLSGADLSDADLNNADLTYANLTRREPERYEPDRCEFERSESSWCQRRRKIQLCNHPPCWF